MGSEMRLAKVLHRVVSRLPIAAAIVAAGPIVAVGQNGNVRYAPSGYLQAEPQHAAGLGAAGTEAPKGPLFGGQQFTWPKMPFVRSKPSDRSANVAHRPHVSRTMPQQAASNQRFAAQPQSRTQRRPAAMSAHANTRQVPQRPPVARVAQPTVHAAGPIANQAIPVASRQQPAPTIPATSPATTVVAPLSPAQRLLAQAHELSNTANSEDDFSRVVSACRQVQSAQADSQLTGYANELCSWALNRRGQLKAEAGRDEEAISDFDDAIAADGTRWRAFHNRGVLLAQAGQFEKAFDDFNCAIEFKPDFAKAYSNRGALFVVAGNYKTAAEDYDQAIQLDPKLAIAHRGYARACHLMGDLDAAIRHYDCAVELNPKDAYAIASRADVLTDLGRFAEAASEYERAIKVDPKSGHAYSGSAWLLAACPDDSIRNTKLAIERAQTGLELNGDGDAASYDTLAAAQANAGDFDAAVQSVQQAIGIASTDEKAAYSDRLTMYENSQPYRLHAEADVVQASYESE